MTENYGARRLEVNGIVQGVRFRPFIYQLASKHQIKGEVANASSGVSIHTEGALESLKAFWRELPEKAPPLAYITEISIDHDRIKGYRDFAITKSMGRANKSTLISPDVSNCDDCLREMFDPADRRHHYSLINCTNCGPRYTITEDISYDRPSTSMKHFRTCKRCQAE